MLAGATGLVGAKAREYLNAKVPTDFKITPKQQLKLFNFDYAKYLQDTQRLCTKADVQVAYGKCDWNGLDPAIKEVLVDLRYRGDYTPAARKIIQRSVSNNDLKEFKEAVSHLNAANISVPSRQRSRVKFLEQEGLKRSKPTETPAKVYNPKTPIDMSHLA